MSHKFTVEYFMEERARFQEMMGDCRHSVDDLTKAYGSLWYVAVNCPGDERVDVALESALTEHSRRAGYRLTEQMMIAPESR